LYKQLKGRRFFGSDAAWVAALNAPAILLIAGLIGYPVFLSVWISLHRYNLRRPDEVRFVGAGNYARILSSPEFWAALNVTATFALVSVAAIVAIGTGVALLFHENFRARGAARALLLIPWAIPGVVNGLMWKGLLGKYGGINALLSGAHGLSIGGVHPISWLPASQAWLVEPQAALLAAAMAHVWKEAPFAAIIFLAALQAIPSELDRAARVDGAGAWRRFRSVTLPWLFHPLLIVAIFETMTAFRAFDLIFTLTGGGPGRATTVIAWQTYLRAFRFVDFGSANAYSYLIAIMTMTLTIVYIRLLYRRGAVQA
jgi:multiple sugar transport system permease protein